MKYRALLALTLFFAPKPLHATPNFPSVVAQHLGLAKSPDCTLCHVGTPQAGTANTPFAFSMRQRGLQKNDVGSLTGALDALAGEQTDSDGDGFPDIDEIKKGWDPNVPSLADGGVDPNAARPQVLNPTYGCSASRPAKNGTRPISTATFAWLSALVPFRRRRLSTRRRAHRRSPP